MNKLLTTIVGAVLGATMAVGVGVAAVNSATKEASPAHAAETEIAFTPGTDTGETSVTKSGVTVTMTTMNNASYYQIYANQSGTFTCSSGTITKIEFTCTASGTSKYGPGNTSSDVGTYSYSGNKGTWTGDASSITLSSTAQVRMSTLSVTHSSGSAKTLTSISLSGDMSKTSYTTEESWDPSGLVVTGTYSDSSTDNTLASSATFAYYSNSAMTSAVATPNDLGTGTGKTLYVKATVSGVSNSTGYSQTVNVSAPTYTDTYNLDGKNIIISASNGTYLPKDIGTSGKPNATTTKSDSAIFLFEIVGNNQFTLKLTNGTNAGKYLKTGTKTGGDTTLNVGTTAETWTVETNNGNKYLKDEDTHYLAANGTTDWRMYANTSNGYPIMSFEEASDDPAITAVAITGSPTANDNLAGGYEWTMSATVTAVNDENEPYALSRNVNWTVSPSNAVIFSKTTSSSGESITVRASNDSNRNGVVITASSAATGFTSIHADSNAFNIIKSYTVATNTLVTKDGGSEYDGNGSASKVVTLTSTMTYSGDAGEYKVNLSVSPSAGVTLSASNPFTSSSSGADFTATFTKSGSYTITSTPIENNAKAASVTITISNVVTPGYELITNASNLAAGSKIVIYSTYVSSQTTYNRLMSTTYNSNNVGYSNFEITNEFISASDVSSHNAEVLTLVDSGDGYWYLKNQGNKYLWADDQANSHNYLRQVAETSDNTKFSITFNGNGVPSVVPYVDSGRKIQFNHGNTCFSCYTGTNFDIQIYQWINTDPYFTISASTAHIGVRGTETLTITAHNGASANISWSTGDSSKVSIPANSTGNSVVITGVAVTTSSVAVTATFTPLDGNSYANLTCAVSVVAIDQYVSLGVTQFTKVTSTPADWTGTYLIVDETSNICFDGSASPLMADATRDVTINNSSIAATTEMLNASFNVKESENDGYYNIRSNSGYYIGGSDKSININIGTPFDVTFNDDFEIVCSSATLQHTFSGGNFFRFYTNHAATAHTLSLYKANGERRAISNTLTNWYDDAKANNYLVCNASGTGSAIDWDSLYDSAILMLASEDYDTLKTMTAKSSEDNGNFLEDFISDYDYLVMYKGYTDFLGRFDEGGAMYGNSRVVSSSIISNVSSNIATVTIILSLLSFTTIGGYFLLRKKKED